MITNNDVRMFSESAAKVEKMLVAEGALEQIGTCAETITRKQYNNTRADMFGAGMLCFKAGLRLMVRSMIWDKKASPDLTILKIMTMDWLPKYMQKTLIGEFDEQEKNAKSG